MLMLPRNRVPEYPGEGESRVRGNVQALVRERRVRATQQWATGPYSTTLP